MFCKQLQVVLKFSAFVVVVPLKKTVYVTLHNFVNFVTLRHMY